jgi:hypothetical protein
MIEVGKLAWIITLAIPVALGQGTNIAAPEKALFSFSHIKFVPFI